MHNRNYRRYFIGQWISVSGTWMQQTAQLWLILQLTHNNGTAVGLVTAFQFLPMLIFGAWGGVLADRFDKRKLLYGTQIAAGILALVLGVIVTTGTAAVWNVYVLSVLLGFVNVVDNPARQTFVLEMVGPEDLPNAVSLNSVVMNCARVVGPSIAGFVIEAFRNGSSDRLAGIAPCFYVNAVSYVAVIIALMMMEGSLLHRLPTVKRAKGQLREGLRYAWSERMVRTPLLMMAVIGTLAFNFQVVISLIATKTFHTGAGGFGTLYGVMGAGAVLGGLSVASRRGVSYRRLITLSMVMGVTILVAAVAPTLVTEGVALFAMGAAAFAFVAVANTTIQLTAAPEMRGRVMALYAIAFLGSTPIGGPTIGWISQHFGAAVRLCDRRGGHHRGDRGGRVVDPADAKGRRPAVPRRDRGPDRLTRPATPPVRRRRPDADDATPTTRRRRRGRRALLLVALDGRRVARRRGVGVEAELALGAALAQQVEALVEHHLDLAEPHRIVLRRLLQGLLFGDQLGDALDECSVVHG